MRPRSCSRVSVRRAVVCHTQWCASHSEAATIFADSTHTPHRDMATNLSGMIEQFDWIAFVQHAFDDDCTVHSGGALVSLSYFFQYRRCSL